ncbi:MAG TPA: hypothetical protein PLS59_10800 [Kiritimatiellia bacterium]|nr:hypothetical protein [Kiritimatiellia bacterium]
MAFQYFITKDEYVTGPLDTDVKAVNPVREEVVYAVVDTLDSEESGTLANPKRPIYKSVRPNAKGIYITDDADAQTALAAKVTARPDMFAGPYSSLELALAAIEANTPKTTHIPRPDESE